MEANLTVESNTRIANAREPLMDFKRVRARTPIFIHYRYPSMLTIKFFIFLMSR